MNSLIPDTLQGALTLSLIDFLLSFVVISFIGILLTGFPLLNRIAAWLEARQSTAIARAAADRTQPVAGQDIAQEEVAQEDIAAIVAAISAVMGEHRILHIEPAQHGAGWVAASRQTQHQSHLPPRHFKR